MGQTYVVKAPLKQRIGNWCNDHVVEIGVGTIGVLGVGCGLVWGYMLGDMDGYARGLKAFRNWHADTAKKLLDTAGHQGAFEALNYVRNDKEVYDQLLKDPDSVLNKVGEKFYASDWVKDILEVLEE